jgi:CRP-like cAMP-binding protein
VDSNYSSLFELIGQWYSLTEDTKEAIQSKSELRRIKRGDYLFQEGQQGDHLFFVVQGCIRAFVLDNDFKEHNIRFGFENEVVGDIQSFRYQTKSTLNLQALENTVVLQVNPSNLRELFTLDTSLSLFYKDFLEFELSHAQKRIINQLSKNSENRYLDFLEQYGQFNNRLPDRHIASYIGVTPEFFSKLKKRKIREFLELG